MPHSKTGVHVEKLENETVEKQDVTSTYQHHIYKHISLSSLIEVNVPRLALYPLWILKHYEEVTTSCH